ncbi:methylated-DNA--[protein]-cysteine S-methyltransferase [Paenibacillus guangzhouensis]|uniref:methylated-DNA--[protein]-cysteine S-methyltransferase n=1 Tax=Paenibacillus guangzhouensis TaxID=1473112 RepID=UPI0012676987
MTKAKNHTLYWSTALHGGSKFYFAATDQGLCYVGSPDRPYEEMVTAVSRHRPDSTWIQDDEGLKTVRAELVEYMEGTRRDFSFTFDLIGTPFQLAVWQALCRIPYGETRSYAEIAQAILKPAAVRAVGAAIGANPVLVVIPCHRVIGKNGAMTGYRGGLDMKTKLLQLEQQQSREQITC